MKASAPEFRFQDGGPVIEKRVTRRDFEGWIEPELRQIGECVDRLMAVFGTTAITGAVPIPIMIVAMMTRLWWLPFSGISRARLAP